MNKFTLVLFKIRDILKKEEIWNIKYLSAFMQRKLKNNIRTVACLNIYNYFFQNNTYTIHVYLLFNLVIGKFCWFNIRLMLKSVI